MQNNEIKHWTITIDYDVWGPFKRQSDEELSELLGRIKDKSLLAHCGNVKAVPREHEGVVKGWIHEESKDA